MGTMPYQPKYDIPRYDFNRDLAFGEQAEESIKRFLQSVLGGSIEVKCDRYRNGKMVVETQQHRRYSDRRTDASSFWYESGINVTTADWWVYMYSLNEAFIAVSVPRLRRYLRYHRSKYNDHTKRIFAETSDNPSRGWLLLPDDVMDMLINPKYDDRQHDQQHPN